MSQLVNSLKKFVLQLNINPMKHGQKLLDNIPNLQMYKLKFNFKHFSCIFNNFFLPFTQQSVNRDIISKIYLLMFS